MNYSFPKIETIEDVKPYLDEWEEFRITDKGDYTVVNYMVGMKDTFNAIDGDTHSMVIRRECRGLIFDSATGKLLSRPYHKFFNANEKPETSVDEVDWSAPHHILEKLDGSMIRPIPIADGFRLGTKAGVTEVAMNVEIFIANKPNYAKFITTMLSNGLTPIFEWVSRKNRIVVDYPEDNLILTAVRDIHTGMYESYSMICTFGYNYDIPVVQAILMDGGPACIDVVRAWDTGEGVVFRFDSGHMIKVKADQYILCHTSKEQINLEKNVIQVIINDSIDDILPLLTEADANRLQEFQTQFWVAVREVAQEVAELYSVGARLYPNQKEFAVNYVNTKAVEPQFRPFLFGMRQGNGNAEQLIIKQIAKSLTSQNTVDANRWLWKNLNWN